MNTVYRLTNIDTGKHAYFASLEGAMTAGDKMLDMPKGAKLHWPETLAGFSVESQVGYQKNDGKKFLAIIPLKVEA